ncbi:MAG TPA: hypothetical protein VEH09_12315, partial [Thermodesulfobacteriota bacterium]|nr:hypothetical protein [Thermodesulfobacteriota bacterium]
RDLVENLPKIWFQYQWTSSMKNRLERTQCFLVIIISFFLAVYPVYFQYSDLVEFDFFLLARSLRILTRKTCRAMSTTR